MPTSSYTCDVTTVLVTRYPRELWDKVRITFDNGCKTTEYKVGRICGDVLQ
jgi:hypothetical protein